MTVKRASVPFYLVLFRRSALVCNTGDYARYQNSYAGRYKRFYLHRPCVYEDKCHRSAMLIRHGGIPFRGRTIV